MARPPTDFELLDQIRRFYDVPAAHWWTETLRLLVTVTRAEGGFVGVDDGAISLRASMGKVPEVIDDFPTRADLAFVHDGARLRIHHDIFPHETVWSLHGCCEDPRRRVRLATLARHLQLAGDFALGRSGGGALPSRVQRPDGLRRVAVADALRRMSERAGACALLAARGYTNGQIGEYLHLNAASVARALQAAYRGFGIRGRAELDVAALLLLPKPAAAVAEAG